MAVNDALVPAATDLIRPFNVHCLGLWQEDCLRLRELIDIIVIELAIACQIRENGKPSALQTAKCARLIGDKG